MIRSITLIFAVLFISILHPGHTAKSVAGKDYHECVLINAEKACTFDAIETIKSSCAAIHSNDNSQSAPARNTISLSNKIVARHIGYDKDAVEIRLTNTSSELAVKSLTIVFLHDERRTNTDEFIRITGNRPYGSLGASFTLNETIQPGEEKVFYLDSNSLSRNRAYNWQIIDVVSSSR